MKLFCDAHIAIYTYICSVVVYRKADNEVFGDVKKLITQDFVQQGYLVYNKKPETDPVKYEFKWGARAQYLTTKEDVLSFVCQVSAICLLYASSAFILFLPLFPIGTSSLMFPGGSSSLISTNTTME